jgi:hypothetical protein
MAQWIMIFTALSNGLGKSLSTASTNQDEMAKVYTSTSFFSLPIPPLQANKDSNLLRWFSQVVYSLYLGSVYPSAPSSSLRDNYLPVIKRRYGLPAISA